MHSKPEIIFLAGFPRSGTTWFSNLINSHQNIVYRHELIGRNYPAFGEILFNKIKYNNGLEEQDFDKAMEVVRSANVETDKPPFFKKEFGLSNYPKLHHLSWLASKALPPLRPLYNLAFKLPKERTDLKILIKETRSAIDMESMLNGLRVKHKIFLIRRPHGSIASHLKGIEQGKMATIDSAYKQSWFEMHKDHDFIIELKLSEDKLISMSPVELIAIEWCLYHTEIIKLKNAFPTAIVCFYDEFVEQPIELTGKLMKALDLDYSPSVDEFIKQSTGISDPQNTLKDTNSQYFSVYRGKSFKADAYKEQLTENEIELIDRYTSNLFSQLRNLC